MVSTSTADAVTHDNARQFRGDPDAPLGTINAVRPKRTPRSSSNRSFRSSRADTRGDLVSERLSSFDLRDSHEDEVMMGTREPLVDWSAMDDEEMVARIKPLKAFRVEVNQQYQIDDSSEHAISPHGVKSTGARMGTERRGSKKMEPPMVEIAEPTIPMVVPVAEKLEPIEPTTTVTVAPVQTPMTVRVDPPSPEDEEETTEVPAIKEVPEAVVAKETTAESEGSVFFSRWFTCAADSDPCIEAAPQGDETSASTEASTSTSSTQPSTVVTAEVPPQAGIWDIFVAAIDPTQDGTSPKKMEAGNEDDSIGEGHSVGDGKLFGDLKSLPSVNGDTTAAGQDSLCLDDDVMSSPADVASVVANKVHNMNEPTSQPQLGFGDIDSVLATAGPGDKSMEARRHLLIKELRSAIISYGRYDIRCANISAALGDLLDELKEHEQALKLHMDAVTIYTCKLGDDNTTTMNAKLRYGTILENAGQYDEAVKTFYLVTAMRRTLRGEGHPSVADGLLCMAHTLRKKGDFQQAIKELKRSLKIYRESLGDGHEKVSSTVDQIASLYLTIGDFEKSAAILEEVVKLKAVTRGTSSNEVASTLCNLATTYECSEDFPKSLKTLKKAYKIYTEIGGYSCKDATTTLNRIAQLYESTSDYNRASIAYLGVLRGRKINFGIENLSVGETYYRLGHALRETGQLEKALKCMKEALPIFVGQGVELTDVEMIAEIMHEMACINKEKRHFNDAARIFKQELSVRRKIGQPEFPQVAKTLNLLGEAEFEIKNHSRALKYLVEALTIYQDEGEQGVECAEVLFNTGRVFEAVRNKERALEAYVEAIRIFQEHGYGSRHHRVLKAQEKVDTLQGARPRSDESSTTSSRKRLFK